MKFTASIILVLHAVLAAIASPMPAARPNSQESASSLAASPVSVRAADNFISAYQDDIDAADIAAILGERSAIIEALPS